jgi:hypothetical protein
MKFQRGRKKSKPDIRRLKLARYLIPGALPTPPLSVDYTQKVTGPWNFFLNDSEGDCVVAAAGHSEMVFTANGLGLWVPTDDDIQKAYEDVAGYDPSQTQPDGSNPTDVGTDPVTFLNYWNATGLGLISSPETPHKIGAYIQADATKPMELQLGVDMFDLVYLGVELPDAVVTALEAGNVIPWVIPDNADSSWQPDPNNGHMVMAASYDASGVYVVTWGQILLASWDFLANCCDEPFVIVSPEIVGPGGISPAGFDLPTLQADLARITQ